MSKIRNTFILAIVVLVLLAGGMKWLMHYYTEKAAKDVQANLPPGMFKYAGISAPLDGKASIDDISINIAGETITIAKIELASENILDPIQLFLKSWGKNFPSELALNIKGVTINTSSLMSNRSILNTGRLALPLNIPCGRVKALSFAEFVEMGYHTFTFDLTIAYKLVSTNRIKVDLTLTAPDVIQSQLSYYGNLTTALQKPKKAREDAIAESSQPIRYNVPDLELQIDDFPLQRKLYNYCANKEQQSLDSYLKNITPFPKDLVDKQTTAKFGLVLSQEIVNALNAYQKDPKEFYLAIHPTGPNTLEELQKMDEGSVVKNLRPQLRVNGNNITINFQWLSRAELTHKRNIDPTKTPVIKSSERVLVAFEQLNNQANHKAIEVYTATGIVYKGLFRKVSGDFLYMRIQTDRGSSDTRLERSIIRGVYVLNPIN